MPRTIQRFAVIAAATLVLPLVHAGTISVNSTADVADDDGACTLREAIASADSNAASGASAGECDAGEPSPTIDTIAFAIPGSGVHTIAPASALPGITEAVVIDGYTQPGATPNTLAIGDNAVLRIEINGSGVGISDNLFTLQGASAGSTVRGLVINGITQTYFNLISGGNVIEGNFLGTDASGMTYLGNGNLVSIVPGAGNRFGGTTPASRNVIAATGHPAGGTLFVEAAGTVIQGNYIGVNAAGTGALQDPIGTTAVDLEVSAPNTLIGGIDPGAGNVILGTNTGIDIRTHSAGVTIQGNLIGTDATGTVGLGGGFGISGSFSAPNLTIGGSAPGAGNVISGGLKGIELFSVADGLVVQGNKIGTDISGTRPVPNHGNGIHSFSSTPPRLIGGTGPGEGNTIAFNCSDGLDFFGGSWTVLGNSIYSNSGVGIHAPLPEFGGPATPSITSLSIVAGTATLSGVLDGATASANYRIEFFGNVVCDPSGRGEGRTFIGTTDVVTDADGHAAFGPLDFPVPDGEPVVTATATDPDGLTSAFSFCAGIADELFRSDFDRSVCGGGL
ncbi:MAG TPA: CSLREA domain-containing protein [Rhodanobacteraceae bacterium]|nr:CSLREA domain-containing protein [Rhodanobacteraceae bacterium]